MAGIAKPMITEQMILADFSGLSSRNRNVNPSAAKETTTAITTERTTNVVSQWCMAGIRMAAIPV
jgi:hypothetical protein